MSHEQLSALMDGELDDSQLDALLDAVSRDETLLQFWRECDQLKGVLEGDVFTSRHFMAGFSEKLAAEPVVLSPRYARAGFQSLRRIVLPLTVAASVAFVSIAVWQIGVVDKEPSAAAQMAAESDLAAYLAAHRESDGNLFAGRETMQVNFQITDTH